MRVTGITNTRKYISNESDMKLSVRKTTNSNTSKLLTSPSFSGNAKTYLNVGKGVLDRLRVEDSSAFINQLRAIRNSQNETIFINLKKTNVTGYEDVAFRISTRPKTFILKHLYVFAKSVGHLISGKPTSGWWTKQGILHNGESGTDIINRFTSIVNKNND